jgi:hypothetical protein
MISCGCTLRESIDATLSLCHSHVLWLCSSSEKSSSFLCGVCPGVTKAVAEQARQKHRRTLENIFSTSTVLLHQWVGPYRESAEAAAAQSQLAAGGHVMRKDVDSLAVEQEQLQ